MLVQPLQQIIELEGQLPIYIETGKLARQADGAVTVKQGNCVILATVVANKEMKEGQSFFPLTVDYVEKFASAGRIPGSFHKREGRITDYEILISRLIDRALRPLFPEDYLCEVQILVTLISSDPEIMPDALACLAASSALAVSDIPLKEFISEVRVGRVDNAFVINPSRTQLEKADMDFMIAASMKSLVMVEGESKECSEADLLKAIALGQQAIQKQIQAQVKLRTAKGITKNREYTKPKTNEALQQKVIAFAQKKVIAVAEQALPKHERSAGFKAIKEELVASFAEGELSDEDKKLTSKYFEDLIWEEVRNMMLDKRKRLDGRKMDEVRPLAMEIDALPSPHGSALFTRGETQSLTTVTLGTSLDEQLIETAAKSEYNKFLLHYNFPPFSTGDVKPMRGPGRREVGHGNLALRSLKQMLPSALDFPYTIRIVSDILESNGSSSMATVCAGSLALMDAGVPFKKHVSGVAMGLITRSGDSKYAILTDILGDEDHLGDMDFKVTGTQDGICGVQMDIKVDGISMEMMTQALDQAKAGRLHILSAMVACTPAPRTEVKPHAPRMTQIIVDKEFIGAIIGPGGKIIQEIQRETGAVITIEEVNGKGEVTISAVQKESMDKALNWVKGIIAIPEVGATYAGVVKGVQDFGAFVEFMPGKQGLLHISEITWKRLETMDGIFKEGDKVEVKLMAVDPKTGKYKLSKKALLPRE